MTRRSALARSGKAPTARVRRLLSPWSRSSPLVEVDGAPLLRRLGEVVAHRLGDAGVGVGDDELDAG